MKTENGKGMQRDYGEGQVSKLCSSCLLKGNTLGGQGSVSCIIMMSGSKFDVGLDRVVSSPSGVGDSKCTPPDPEHFDIFTLMMGSLLMITVR